MKKNLPIYLLFLILTGCKVYYPPTSLPSPAPVSVSSVHLALGNPTNANTDVNNATNYLVVKPQYSLSYNKAKGHPNWVSWELSKDWLGASDRQNDFRPDQTLPATWYNVKPSDYTNSGFDRGHLCPSADRTKNDADNSATFLMTNMIPQAPELNREAWAYLEEYTREVVKKGYKAYITAGVYGKGGEGNNGALSELKNNIDVPARVYKVIVLYPENGSIDENAVVIATDFPNKVSQTKEASWLSFITTPEAIERASSVHFFANLPFTVQNTLKSKRFNYQTSSLEVETTARMYKDKPLYIGKKGGCYYINDAGKKTYVDHSLCGID